MKKFLSKGNIICGIVTILFLILTFTFSEESSMTMQAIEEAVPMSSDRVDTDNDGKVVLVSGRITAEEYSALDDTFSVDVDFPILRRNVEMYQWVRYTDRDGDETYVREWSDKDPVYFRDNPRSMPYQGRKFYSAFSLGAYELSPELVAKLEPLGSWARVGGLDRRTAERFGMELANDAYYIYQDLNNAYVDVGDTRITFDALNISGLSEITIVARQEGNMLVEHRLKDDIYPLGKIYEGIRDTKSILSEEEGEAAFGMWVLGGLTVVFAVVTGLITMSNVKYNKKWK